MNAPMTVGWLIAELANLDPDLVVTYETYNGMWDSWDTYDITQIKVVNNRVVLVSSD